MQILSGGQFSIRKSVESVQRRTTKIVPSLTALLDLCEETKISKATVFTSYVDERARGNMIFAYQLLHNQFDTDALLFHPTTLYHHKGTTTSSHKNLHQVYSLITGNFFLIF